MSATRTRRSCLSALAAMAFLMLLVLYQTHSLLECADACFVDYFAIHESNVAHFEIPDVRLNSWILGWVKHALFSNPTGIFDTNAFHPAPNTLSGSEHMFGVALQTLPFALFSDSPVLLHQSALILSFLILSLSVFALVREVFGSTWGGVIAGAAAAFMPWRFSELGHLQLLSVQWLPLVWLLAIRTLSENGSRRDACWLGLVVGIQMLSSFYLAYLTVFTTAVLAIVLFAATRPPLRAFIRFGAATAVPAAFTALTAIPYLARFSGYRYSAGSTTDFYSDPSVIFALLTPPMALRADFSGIAPLTYHAPIVLLIAAVLALGWYAPAPSAERSRPQRRALVLALLLMSVGAFALMFGRKIVVADTTWTMPSHWLAQIVPGFSQMRAEFRWGITLGLSVPVLAGAGVAWLERCADRLVGSTSRASCLFAVRIASAALVAANVVFFELPARDAWSDAPDVRDAHEAIAALDSGPIAEIPWRLHRIDTATNGSRYMLASSRHWKPLLNGYSAYVPSTYHFLRRIAQGLPDPQTIDVLNRLTGLRWIVVHPGRLGLVDRTRWNAASRDGALSLVVDEPNFRIYEVSSRSSSGAWTDALLAQEPGPNTMTGLPRAAIPPPEEPGRISVHLPDVMLFEHDEGLPEFATVSFFNPSRRDWPGLDIHREGLVLLRARFFGVGGELVREELSSFDRDLPSARTVVARALIEPPNRTGDYRVLFDVGQLRDGEWFDLGFPSVEAAVSVTERKRLPRGGRT